MLAFPGGRCRGDVFRAFKIRGKIKVREDSKYQQEQRDGDTAMTFYLIKKGKKERPLHQVGSV